VGRQSEASGVHDDAVLIRAEPTSFDLHTEEIVADLEHQIRA
jgi:hypothetical protein